MSNDLRNKGMDVIFAQFEDDDWALYARHQLELLEQYEGTEHEGWARNHARLLTKLLQCRAEYDELKREMRASEKRGWKKLDVDGGATNGDT